MTNELQAFFNTYEPIPDPIILDACQTVLNQRKFIDSHINAIKQNSGNKTFLPYYLRLVTFYKIVRK